MKAQTKLHNLICEAPSVRIITHKLIQCRHYFWSNDAVVHQQHNFYWRMLICMLICLFYR